MKPLERTKRLVSPNSVTRDDYQARAPQDHTISTYKPCIDEEMLAKIRKLGATLANPDQFVVETLFPDADWIQPHPWHTRPTRDNFCSVTDDVGYKDQNFTLLMTKISYDIVAVYNPDHDNSNRSPPQVNSNAVATYYVLPAQKFHWSEKRDFFLGYYKEYIGLQQAQKRRIIICTHLQGPSNISGDLPEDSDMTNIRIENDDNASNPEISIHENTENETSKGLLERLGCNVQ